MSQAFQKMLCHADTQTKTQTKTQTQTNMHTLLGHLHETSVCWVSATIVAASGPSGKRGQPCPWPRDEAKARLSLVQGGPVPGPRWARPLAPQWARPWFRLGLSPGPGAIFAN